MPLGEFPELYYTERKAQLSRQARLQRSFLVQSVWSKLPGRRREITRAAVLVYRNLGRVCERRVCRRPRTDHGYSGDEKAQDTRRHAPYRARNEIEAHTDQRARGSQLRPPRNGAPTTLLYSAPNHIATGAVQHRVPTGARSLAHRDLPRQGVHVSSATSRRGCLLLGLHFNPRANPRSFSVAAFTLPWEDLAAAGSGEKSTGACCDGCATHVCRGCFSTRTRTKIHLPA